VPMAEVRIINPIKTPIFLITLNLMFT